MSEPYKIVITVIVDGDGNILMIRRVRSKGDDNSLKWEFPAGHIDGGERPEVAAVREVFEETGLEVYLMPWKVDLPTKAGKAAQFLGFVANGDIKPEPDLAEDEHDRYVWIKAESLSKVKPTHKNMGENLSKLLKKVKVGLNGESLERSASRRESAETGQLFSGKLHRGAWLVTPEGKVIDCGGDHELFIEKEDNGKLLKDLLGRPVYRSQDLVRAGWAKLGYISNTLYLHCIELMDSYFNFLHDLSMKFQPSRGVDVIIMGQPVREIKFKNSEFMQFNSKNEVFRALRVQEKGGGQEMFYPRESSKRMATGVGKPLKKTASRREFAETGWSFNPDVEYAEMRDSTEYILFNRRNSRRRQANQLLPTRTVRQLPEPAGDLKEAILVGDEVEIFLKDQASRGDNPTPDINGIVDRRNRNTLWIRPLEEDEDSGNRVRSPLTWKNDGDWAFIRVYRDPDQVIHYIKGNPYDPDGKVVEKAKGIGLILETNPPDRFESVFALMRNETPDLDRSMGQVPESFDEVAPFNKPRPGIPPILHRVREVLRDSGLEPDLVDHVGNGRVLILTQDSDLKKDIVRVLQKGGVEVKASRRGDLIAIEGCRRMATGVGGTTTIPIATDDELMRPTVVQRQQKLRRQRERKTAQGTGVMPGGQGGGNNLGVIPGPSITIKKPADQIQTLKPYGDPEVLPGGDIQMNFGTTKQMEDFTKAVGQTPLFEMTQKAAHREKRQAARYSIKGFRRAMRQGDYGSAGEFLTRLLGMNLQEESIVRSRLAGRREWAELNHYATGVGDLGISRLSRKASRMAPDL